MPANAGIQECLSRNWIPAGVYPRAALCADPGAGMTILVMEAWIDEAGAVATGGAGLFYCFAVN